VKRYLPQASLNGKRSQIQYSEAHEAVRTDRFVPSKCYTSLSWLGQGMIHGPRFQSRKLSLSNTPDYSLQVISTLEYAPSWNQPGTVSEYRIVSSCSCSSRRKGLKGEGGSFLHRPRQRIPASKFISNRGYFVEECIQISTELAVRVLAP
jgi:hypothetical protein